MFIGISLRMHTQKWDIMAHVAPYPVAIDTPWFHRKQLQDTEIKMFQ
jgi:hypothetical protein